MFAIFTTIAGKTSKRAYVTLLLLLAIVSFTTVVGNNAEASSADADKLYIIKQDDKYGYIDRDGNVVIKPIYLNAKDFAEGVAPVKIQEGTWSILNTKGEIIGTWKYVDEINAFSEGLAVVRKGAKYGYINKKQLVIPVKFDNAYGFSEGMAVVAIREGNTLAERLNAKYGYIDKNGNVVIDFQYRAAGNFKEGVAPVSSTTGFGWGYIDKTGQYVIEPNYFAAKEFSEGLAPVSVGPGKTGFISHEGKFVIPPQYSWASGFSEGIACVKSGEKIEINSSHIKVVEIGKYGYIDKAGEFVIKPIFNYAESFRGDLARVYDQTLGFGDDKYQGISFGYIDKNGKIKWQLTR
ncbi:WG containing repeat-containing protein [Sporomusa malonica]|uniref:WG containing repeat-containing protein n=2 Tax=Sporomusa malonica TaxID=112901 RepID=A0A1W2CSV1_9FIRM|nr:WG containing repeat-containing protein [Sporomusa malonica]